MEIKIAGGEIPGFGMVQPFQRLDRDLQEGGGGLFSYTDI